MIRILLVSGDADHNVGDAAIRHAICAALAQADRSVRISIVAAERRLAHPPPAIAAVLPKGFRHAGTQWRAARHHDLVVVGGGGLFQDDDSRVKMPYWATRIAALRASGTAVAGHCVGAGPLTHVESRLFARLACANLRSLTVRDEFARTALQPCTGQPLKVVPDPAFMLAPRPQSEAVQLLRSLGVPAGRPLIGVALRRWFHTRGGFIPNRVRASLGWRDDAGRAERISALATLAATMQRLTREMDADVLLLPSYPAPHEGDVHACAALAAQLPGVRTYLARIRDPRLYKAVTGEVQLLVSARMHPLILAAGMGTPIVGLGYNGKFDGCLAALEASAQLMRLDDLAGTAGSAQLERCVQAALGQGAALRERAAALAARSEVATRALLELAR